MKLALLVPLAGRGRTVAEYRAGSVQPDKRYAPGGGVLEPVDDYLRRLPLAQQGQLKDHVQAAVLAIGMCQRVLDATDPERATIS